MPHRKSLLRSVPAPTKPNQSIEKKQPIQNEFHLHSFPTPTNPNQSIEEKQPVQNKVHLRSVPAPPKPKQPIEKKVQVRSGPAPAIPPQQIDKQQHIIDKQPPIEKKQLIEMKKTIEKRKIIEKKKTIEKTKSIVKKQFIEREKSFMTGRTVAKKTPDGITFRDLPDAVICRILEMCDSKDLLRGRSLTTIRQAYSLARTNSRIFALFRNRLQVVDALYPASVGYPSPFLPDYLAPVQMTWIARLAQGRLQAMRLPSYSNGTVDVLVAVEYGCHYIREVGFTDRGMVFPNLANRLFTRCNMITKVEIRAPQASTIRAIWQSACEFREIILLDVDSDCLNTLCAVIEAKGKHLKVLQVAFDIGSKAYGEALTSEEEGWYSNIEKFGDYLKEHLKELPQLEVLDISSSPYYVVEHDRWDVLDAEQRPIKEFSKKLKLEVDKVRDAERNRKGKTAGVGKIRVIRGRSANMEFAYDLVVKHLPLSAGCMVEVEFPGGKLVFDMGNEKRGTLTRLQLGQHLCRRKGCITQECRRVETMDLGNAKFVERFYKDEGGVRAKVAKVVVQESGCVRNVRAVFGLRRETAEMGFLYVEKVMRFAMLATTVDVTYEVVLHGHGVSEGFRGMVEAWKGVRLLRLVNPGNYGGCADVGLSEEQCLGFVSGVQWLLRLLRTDCREMRCVFLEDLGCVSGWKNWVGSRNSIKWAVEAVDEYEHKCLVDCGTLKATLKRWMRECNK